MILYKKVSLISKLFSRHQEVEEGGPSLFVCWPGQSGNEYPYTAYPIDAELPHLPGNYIYAAQSEEGEWIPLYVAQTRDLQQRLEGHEKLQDATENGATHIHVHISTTGQAARCTEEHDLILRWRPMLNVEPKG